MAVTLPGAASAAGLGDMFLSVRGARSGVIHGESQDETHAREIDVLGWSWGMQAASVIDGGRRGRAVARELKIIKRVDSASTPLMSALRSNEVISKAVLTLRKAGRSQLEFLKITIENGRVTSLTIDAGGDGANAPEVFENVTFTFNKITVEYVPQGKDGQAQGSMLYTDEFGG